MIGGDRVTVFEDRPPATVCVELQGSTTSTSQPIPVTFTPQAKAVTPAATRKKAY